MNLYLSLLMIPITPFLFTHLISPSPFLHFSFTIFTVSLSDSVVETCHSGLPKGRTLVLPFTLYQNNDNSLTEQLPLKLFRRVGLLALN